MKRIISVFLIIFICFFCVSYVSAQTFENKELPDFSKDSTNRVDKILWYQSIPRVWTGEYDGDYGPEHVRRKYALKIQEINENTGEITGISFVDKIKGSGSQDAQVKCSYYFSGNLDYETKKITFQGTSFIEYVSNFELVRFDATITNDMKRIKGTTTAWDGSEVDLKATTSSNVVDIQGNDSFEYDANIMNPVLANECMENSLLIYGETIDEGTGYYVSGELKKKDKLNPLQQKLYSEGFKSKNVDQEIRISSLKENDKIDCIHWIFAHKKLKDDTGLIYIIIKGTTGDEWYGDFNVTSPDETYNQEYDGMHYSFDNAAKALKQELEEEIGKLSYSKVKYVVTGHSRGAAVANLVAKELTDDKDNNTKIKDVYGYTFATPTVVSKSVVNEKEYKNIFNFCLDDDFVTYMPLTESNWQYGRYGTTYYANAASLYQTNSYFAGILRNYRNYTYIRNLSYKKTGAYDIAEYVISRCSSVEEFYNKNHIIGYEIIKNESWRDFFYYIFAPLMKGDKKKVIDERMYFTNQEFLTIAGKFMTGGVGYALGDYEKLAYLGTHDPCNYYALTQCLINDSGIISQTSELRNKLSSDYPSTKSNSLNSILKREIKGTQQLTNSLDENEINSLKEFANQNNNLEKLTWNLEVPETWNGVVWNNGHVISINISGLELSGELDVSNLNNLEILDCSCNQLTNINIGETELKELYCEGNYLDLSDNSDLYKSINALDKKGDFVSSCYPQAIEENANFCENDLNKLKAFANTDNNLEKLDWNLENPTSFEGINWEKENSTYYATNIELQEKELTGEINLSGLTRLENINLFGNNITSLDVSDCSGLKSINVAYNKLTNFVYNNDDKITSIFYNNNYLKGEVLDRLIQLETHKTILVGDSTQYISNNISEFNSEEISILKELTKNVEIDINWDKPGDNNYFQWEIIDDKYSLKSIDLSDTNIEGNIDLREFNNLKKVKFTETNISGILLPQSLETLPDRAFAGCENLENLTVTDNWQKIGVDTFAGCDKLTINCIKGSFAEFIAEALEIQFNEKVAISRLYWINTLSNKYYTGEEFSLQNSRIRVSYTDNTYKDISEGFVVSGYDKNKIGVQTIIISYTEDYYTIDIEGKITVFGVTNNKIAYLPDNESVKIKGYIGTAQEVIIPNVIDDKPVTIIDELAFEKSNITKVTIPSSVKKINGSAFANCKTLNEVNFEEGIEEIYDNAFYCCSSLKELYLPSTIKNLGGYVFQNCTSLEKVYLPETINKISSGLFNGCSSLKDVNIPSNITSISQYAFYNCSSLEELNFSDKLEDLSYYAFYGCKSLKYVNMPETINYLGERVFENCTSLIEVHLSKDVSYIPARLFKGCSSLEKINIPDSIQYINNSAFEGCEKIKEIIIPKSLTRIYSSAFLDAIIGKISYSGTEEEWNNINIDSYGNDILFQEDIYTLADGKVIKQKTNNQTSNDTSNNNQSNNGTNSSTNNNNSQTTNNTNSIQIVVDKVYKLKNKTQNTNSITLVWDKVNGATGYEIEKYDTSKKKYVKVTTKEVKTNLYKVTGLKAATIYQFRVRAYKLVNGNKKFGSYSAIVKLTTTTKTPKITKLTAGKKKVIVKFNKVSGTSGYQIQYSTDKKFKKNNKSTSVSKSKNSKTVSKLKAKKKYYVRIRTFKTVNGKKIYSEWSGSKKVTTKK